MKFIAAVFVALAISAQADESDYYQTHYDHYNEQQVDNSYEGYNKVIPVLASAYNSVSEKQDVDMDVILPIVVFGGLGLGALAYIDSLNRQNNLCNKLREVTNAMRTAAAGGANAVNIADPNANGVTGLANANTVINSNRLFINTLSNIQNLDC